MGVTRREGEVLTALAERLSNAEIAERLFISERTVESHVSSLLRKLGVNSRVALAKLARTQSQGPSTSQRLPLPLRGLVRRGPFVGRTAEMAELQRAWAEAVMGERRLVFVAGEAGIGKSRLTAELAAVVHAEGAVVLFGRCDEEALIPYQPFAEALEPVLGVAPPAPVAAVLARVGPELSRVAPGGRAGVPMPDGGMAFAPDAERYRAFEAVDELLTQVATAGPVLLVLDDLHWADRPTVLLLRHLVRHAARSALLAVAAYREDEFDGHPLVELLGDLGREHAYQRLVLGGLDVADVDALLAATAGPELNGDVSTVAEAVHIETDGNPFFVGEVVRHLLESGALAQEGTRWVLDRPLDELGVPDGVREVVTRRLARLPATTSALLPMASVIGREFEVGILAGTAGVPAKEVLSALEPAERARLVVPVGARLDRYAFAHALVHSTLYDALPATRRARLHGRVGEALDAGAVAADPSELARHFCAAGAAGDPDRAADYALRAAEEASQRLAYEPAAALYRMALDQLHRLGPRADRRRAGALVGQGQAYRRAGQNEPARVAFLGGLGVARRLRDPILVAEAALGIGEVSDLWGVDPELVEALEEALRGLRQGHRGLRARVLARLAQALYYDQDPGRRAELSRQAVETARAAGDRASLASVLSTRHVALWGPDDLAERSAAAEEIIDLAQRTGDHELALRGHAWRVVDLLETGDLAEVDREMSAHASLAEELRQPVHHWDAAVWTTMRAILDGRFHDAERDATSARVLGEQVGHPHVNLVYGCHRYWLAVEQGVREDIEVLAEDWRAMACNYPNTRLGVANLDLHLGRESAARAVFESFARHDFADVPRDAVWMVMLAHLAGLCAGLADERRAQSLYDLLRPYAGRLIVVDRGWVVNRGVSYYLGVLAATMGHMAEASEHFEDALTHAERIGARPFAVHTRYGYASALKRHGGEAGSVKARNLARAAVAEAEALGMLHLAGVTRSLLEPASA